MSLEFLFYVAGFLTIVLLISSFSQTYVHIRKNRNPYYKPWWERK